LVPAELGGLSFYIMRRGGYFLRCLFPYIPAFVGLTIINSIVTYVSDKVLEQVYMI
jgi:hypothetical protein